MAEATAAPAPAGSNKMLFIIIGVLMLVLIGGGVGGFLMMNKAPATGPDGQATETAAIEESVYIDLKPEFVINFRDRHDRPKFLKAEMSVATRNPDIEEAVTRHMPAIRNNLVLLLSRQIYDDLVPHEGKEALRQQALAEVQAVLQAQIGEPGVDDLFFSNFVMH